MANNCPTTILIKFGMKMSKGLEVERFEGKMNLTKDMIILLGNWKKVAKKGSQIHIKNLLQKMSTQ